MYGGCSAAGALADTWVWRGGSPMGTWTQRSAVSPPGTRCEAAMSFDAARGTIVLVSGHDAAAPSIRVYASTTWTWDGSTWTLQSTPLAPAPRGAPAMTYDRVHERVVLFGGARPIDVTPGANNPDFDDTWTWDGATWTKLAPIVVPPARAQARLAWDPPRARAVLAGGLSSEGRYTFADAYEWDGSGWSPIVSDYTARRNHAMTSAPDGAGVILRRKHDRAGRHRIASAARRHAAASLGQRQRL